MPNQWIAWAGVAGLAFSAYALFRVIFQWPAAQSTMAANGTTMPRWMAAGGSLILLLVSAVVAISYSSDADRASAPAEQLELVPTSTEKRMAMPDGEMEALAQSTANLMDNVDVFPLARPELLRDQGTYYRAFDNPITEMLTRWQPLQFSDDIRALCREALSHLQLLGMAVHGGRTPGKYVEEDRAAYLNLKRRCKAAVAGDIAEAERRR